MSGLGTIGYRNRERIRMLLKVTLSLGLFLAGLDDHGAESDRLFEARLAFPLFYWSLRRA